MDFRKFPNLLGDRSAWERVRVNYSVGVKHPAQPDDVVHRISTRKPTAVSATEDYVKQPLRVDLQSAYGDPKYLQKAASLIQPYSNYKPRPGKSDPKSVVESFKDHLVDNLLWLHDTIHPQHIRDRSKLWYHGGRKIIEDLRSIHGMGSHAIAGVMAALSPSYDWFRNRELGSRVLDIYKNHQDTNFGDDLHRHAMSLASNRVVAADNLTPLVDAIKGRPLRSLDPAHAAAFVRVMDSATNPKSYRMVSPEGAIGDFVRTKGGAEGQMTTQSLENIKRAIEILRSPHDISSTLGTGHKVRNFYNNLLIPAHNQHGDVTIDTHAVAGAHLQPFSNTSEEVDNNFSRPGSTISGLHGLYPVYADAYREAAGRRGLGPHEFQSVTWEAVRNLFPDAIKKGGGAKQLKQSIADEWSKYREGRISASQARENVYNIARSHLGGKIGVPSWAGGEVYEE